MLARGDEKVGLRVDRVLDVVPMTAPQIPDAAMSWEGCPAGLLRGKASRGAEAVFFLDALRYVESTGPGGLGGPRPWMGGPGA
jgi:chemotaxis signal transduction protein